MQAGDKHHASLHPDNQWIGQAEREDEQRHAQPGEQHGERKHLADPELAAGGRRPEGEREHGRYEPGPLNQDAERHKRKRKHDERADRPVALDLCRVVQPAHREIPAEQHQDNAQHHREKAGTQRGTERIVAR
jgi:hypothetical protein